jgi:hypothetical protein
MHASVRKYESLPTARSEAPQYVRPGVQFLAAAAFVSAAVASMTMEVVRNFIMFERGTKVK